MASEYFKRWCVCMAGLLLCGTGSYCTVQASAIGIGAWETFQTGLSLSTGILYGNCTVMVSFAIILIDLLLKGKIGIGTLIAVFGISFLIQAVFAVMKFDVSSVKHESLITTARNLFRR